MKSTCIGLELQAESEQVKTKRVCLHLSAARCRIVNEAAPFLSRLLIGSTTLAAHEAADSSEDSSKSDSRSPELSEQISKGIVQLDASDRVLTEIEEQDKETDTDSLRRRTELLRAFAGAFAALAEPSDTPESRQRLIDACGELATYVDDDDKKVAESAKLWQVVAYRRAGKPDRALQVARPVLSPPASSRIGLFMRIERCRALADKGDFVSALSLAARIAARVEGWFESEDESIRNAALSEVKSLQSRHYKAWAAKLRADGNTDRAKVCDEEADKLKPDEKALNVIELGESIAGVPELTDAATKPADSDEEDSDEP